MHVFNIAPFIMHATRTLFTVSFPETLKVLVRSDSRKKKQLHHCSLSLSLFFLLPQKGKGDKGGWRKWRWRKSENRQGDREWKILIVVPFVMKTNWGILTKESWMRFSFLYVPSEIKKDKRRNIQNLHQSYQQKKPSQNTHMTYTHANMYTTRTFFSLNSTATREKRKHLKCQQERTHPR